jgi:hypothetical protein
MTKALAIGAVLLTALVGVLGAQVGDAPHPTRIGDDAAPAFFRPGIRLRIEAPSITRDLIVGTVQDVRRDTVVLDTADVESEQRLFFPSTVMVDRYRRVEVTVGAMGRVEASRGRNHFLGSIKGGIRGAFIGGMLAGVGSLSGQNGISLREFTRGFTRGAVLGFSIGAPIGYNFGVEQWQLIPLPHRNRAPRPTLLGTNH